MEVIYLDNEKQELEKILKAIEKKPIKKNPFSDLPQEALKEALKTIYEFGEEFDTKEP